MREGWWLCALKPRVTYRTVKCQQRIIEVERGESSRRFYELNWCEMEIAELRRQLAEASAALAGDQAFRRRVEAGGDHGAAAVAAQSAHDQTLWLERSAHGAWQERKQAYVEEMVALLEQRVRLEERLRLEARSRDG